MAAKKKGAMKGCGVKNGCKSKKGGLTAAGRKKINRKTGSNLKEPVTESNPTGKRAARKKSFCARSRGWTGERGKAARKRWKC
jgi:hypothetical protein